MKFATNKKATEVFGLKSESKIQQEIFRHFWNTHCLPKCEHREVIFHVPNEGQHRLVNIGVLAGVSDLLFSWRGVMYFCEVKDAKGKQMPSQVKFEDQITNAGFDYFIVRSLDEFNAWCKENLKDY